MMSTELAAGTIFTGRYRVLRRIAAGGMGAVYEVEHVETERRRALKVMHAHLFENEDLRDRFRREARVAARVDSEFIVDVFDAGVEEATKMPFLVMELLRGEDLGKRIKRGGPLPETEAVAYLHQVAQALDKTHKVSIIHRDLKPDNVFLLERDDGVPRVKVLDYGIAKIIADGATKTATSQLLGTPTYMAPEQFNSRASLTPAVDIYALGMMTYTCLVGAPYWAEEARAGNMFALLNVVYRGPSETASVRALRCGMTLPPAFDEWFARATAIEPTERFPTATAAIAALARVLETSGFPHDDPADLGSAAAASSTNSLLSPPLDRSPTAGADASSTTLPPIPVMASSDMTASGAATTQAIRISHPKSRPLVVTVSVGALAIVAGAIYFALHSGIRATGDDPLSAVSSVSELPSASTPVVQAVPVGPPPSPSTQVVAKPPATSDTVATTTTSPKRVPTPSKTTAASATASTPPVASTPPSASTPPAASAPRPKFARD